MSLVHPNNVATTCVYCIDGSLPVLHEWILWRLQPSGVECVCWESWAGPTARHHCTAWLSVPAQGYSLPSRAPCSCGNPGTETVNSKQLAIGGAQLHFIRNQSEHGNEFTVRNLVMLRFWLSQQECMHSGYFPSDEPYQSYLNYECWHY